MSHSQWESWERGKATKQSSSKGHRAQDTGPLLGSSTLSSAGHLTPCFRLCLAIGDSGISEGCGECQPQNIVMGFNCEVPAEHAKAADLPCLEAFSVFFTVSCLCPNPSITYPTSIHPPALFHFPSIRHSLPINTHSSHLPTTHPSSILHLSHIHYPSHLHSTHI